MDEKKEKKNKRNTENSAYRITSKTSSLYVNLRCMELGAINASIYVGGGVTANSIAENEFDVEAPKEWNKEILQAGDIITPDMWDPSGYFGYRRPVHIDYIERDPDDDEYYVVLDEEGFELKLVNNSLKYPYMVGGF